MTKYTESQKHLAVEWAEGKVTLAEVSRKLKKAPVGTYIALALMLREVIRK